MGREDRVLQEGRKGAGQEIARTCGAVSSQSLPPNFSVISESRMDVSTFKCETALLTNPQPELESSVSILDVFCAEYRRRGLTLPCCKWPLRKRTKMSILLELKRV